jgi:hypothetical protein
MQTMNERVRRTGLSWLRVTVGIVVLLLFSGLALAQQPNQKTFASAEEATNALFAAVHTNNEEAVAQIFGGKKELVSSGNDLDDQHDREMFAAKFQEMHRLVEEPDGTTMLYLGAENWPFPVPLVLKNGSWYFDADRGSEEVLYRRIGENEANTIEICQKLAAAKGREDADVQLTGIRTNPGGTASGESATNEPQPAKPLHGYFFRQLKTGNTGTGSAIVMAYPAEYRGSGVMTFVITPNGAVYEKDLGPQTATVAKAMTTWKADRSWRVAK